MRRVLLFVVLSFFGLGAPAAAQCPPVYYGPPVNYGGYPGTASYRAGYAPYTAYYATYPSYAPFRALQPSYPAFSAGPAARYGTRYGAQTTYFRGQPGAAAAPGGSFFGGYDYQVTYPADWYGGYWTWW